MVPHKSTKFQWINLSKIIWIAELGIDNRKKGTVDGWGIEPRSGKVREGYEQNTVHKSHFKKSQRRERDQLEDTLRK